MKTWMFFAALFFATSLAVAADTSDNVEVDSDGSAVQPVPTGTAAKRHKARALPRGDLRHCLKLKDNHAIIACAEGRRRN